MAAHWMDVYTVKCKISVMQCRLRLEDTNFRSETQLQTIRSFRDAAYRMSQRKDKQVKPCSVCLLVCQPCIFSGVVTSRNYPFHRIVYCTVFSCFSSQHESIPIHIACNLNKIEKPSSILQLLVA